jgi:hypothetical protein
MDQELPWDTAGGGRVVLPTTTGGPAGDTHLTADVTDSHMHKDGGLFHPFQVHMPIAWDSGVTGSPGP